MRGLLDYYLEEISSLKHFYDSEKKSINTKSKRGMKDNRFGFLIDTYLQIFTSGTDTDRERESYLALEQYAQKHISIIDIKDAENSKVVTYKFLDEEDLKRQKININIKNAAKMFKQFYEMPIIHQNNTLIMLLAKFEDFVSGFFRKLYQLYPHKYLDNQTVTFSEISSLGAENIKERILAREIDGVMRKSYEIWFKTLTEHNMKFDCCGEELEQLKEIYARRNIIVHNSGKVNESYLKNVPNSTYKLDEILYVDDEYINKAFDVVEIIIFSILIEATRIIPDDKSQYVTDIFNKVFDELSAEKYTVCYNVYNSLMKNKNTEDVIRQMSKINFWISAKEEYGLDSIREDVERFDVSALEKIFSLAKVVLLEEYDKATEIIEFLLEKKEIGTNEINQWPLFKKYRTSSQFAALKSEYAECFGIASLETTPESLEKDTSLNTSIRNEIEEAQA